MKDKKTKNHKENWIGNIIRGFLLFMPLLAIGVTCAYAIFNKNAYQSYYGETINDVSNTDLNSNNDINNDIDYYYDSTRLNDTLFSGSIYYTSCEYLNSSSLLTTEQIDIINSSVRFYYYRGTSTTFYLSDNTSLVVAGTIEVILNDINKVATSANAYRGLYYKSYNFNSYIDNVFYYSIDKVQQSPLFNWSTNTGMYNVIHGACTTLGIESTFVPFLLAYWLLTYLIYIIYDIALLIVNMAHNRIHDVESSI